MILQNKNNILILCRQRELKILVRTALLKMSLILLLPFNLEDL